LRVEFDGGKYMLHMDTDDYGDFCSILQVAVLEWEQDK